MRQLDILALAIETYRLMWTERRALLYVAAIPFLLTLAVTTVARLYVDDAMPPGFDEIAAVQSLEPGLDGQPTEAQLAQARRWTVLSLLALVSMVLMTPFFTAWHRVSLLGVQRAAPRLGYGFGRAEARYLFYLIGFSLMSGVLAFMLLGILGALDGRIALPLTVAAIIAVGARLSLILPPSSIDAPLRVTAVWRLGDGMTLRLIALFSHVAVPTYVVVHIVASTAAGLLPHFGTEIGRMTFYNMLLLASELIVYAVVTTAFSLAYRDLSGFDPNRAAANDEGDEDE